MKKSILILGVALVVLVACRDKPSSVQQNAVPSEANVERSSSADTAPKVDEAPKPASIPASSSVPISDSVGKGDSVAVVDVAKKENENSKSAQQTAVLVSDNQNQQLNEGVIVLDMLKTFLLIGGLCLLFLILIFIVYRKLNKEIKGFRGYFGRTKQGDRIADIERKIKELQNQLNSIQNARSNHTPRPVATPVVAQQRRDEFTVCNEQSTLIEQALYFSAIRRFDNGAYGFDASRANISFVPFQSKYRLILNIDRTTAQVDIVADNFADMINIPQDFVDPVCQAEGQSTVNTRRVVCQRAGQAKLMGGNWIVTEKMIVRYE